MRLTLKGTPLLDRKRLGQPIGEHDVPSDAGDAQVCARDAAGNETCVNS